MRVVSVFESHDKIMCARNLAGMNEFFVRCILITPAKIFLNGSREKDILLKHHRNLLAKAFDIVFSYISSAHFDRACGNIVKSRNELYQT